MQVDESYIANALAGKIITDEDILVYLGVTRDK